MNYILRFFFLVFIIINFNNSLYGLESHWGLSEVSKVRLISPLSHNDNQTDIILGLEYQMEPGWKTYWQSPGDGGFPQELSWLKSVNVKDIQIDWPTPDAFEILDIKSVGYEDNVIFPLRISLRDTNKVTEINLSTNYLTCKDICIPGNAKLNLSIPAGKAKSTKYFFKIEKTLSSLPQKNINLTNLSNFDASLLADDSIISFNITATTNSFFDNPDIYLHTSFGLPIISPVLDYSLDNKKLTAKFYFDRELITTNKFNFSALLIDKNHNFLFESSKTIRQLNKISNLNVFYFYFAISLLAGLILNFMPCVFPILSIKLLSVLETNQKDTRISFLITSFGIIVSFLLLALTFYILQQFNIDIFWGMQFQQPYFLIVITFILSIFMLNLFGLFEFRTPYFINTSIFNKSFQNKYTKNFFNGFFATIMATPCSAPFVGTAITAAFTQSNFIMFNIFFAMGIGMSVPYLVISLFPSLISFLPKPGAWMKKIKYFLGFLLLLTLIWIANIFLNHFNYYFIIFTLFLFCSLIYFIKQYTKKLLISFIFLVFFLSLPSFNFFHQNNITNQHQGWEGFFEIKIEDRVSKDQIVFLDITADWCVTCQYNKINVLNKNKIIKAFEQNNIIRVRADWTVPNKEIDNFLNSHQKYGIPFNAFFSKDYPSGLILSELLSEKEVLDVLSLIVK